MMIETHMKAEIARRDNPLSFLKNSLSQSPTILLSYNKTYFRPHDIDLVCILPNLPAASFQNGGGGDTILFAA